MRSNTFEHSTLGNRRIVQLVSTESGTISNVTQQVFVGDYELLKDAFIHPSSVFERTDVDSFVGRKWLEKQLDEFLENNDRGTFEIEGEAGIGKTAYLAHLVRRRGYIHHFVELAPGSEGISIALRNLSAQLITAWELDPHLSAGVLPNAATRPDFLQNLIFEAADKRDRHNPDEKIVIVVDALDEAGAPYRQNVLGLPRTLPTGTYLIVSHRPGQIALRIDGPRELIRIQSSNRHNVDDIDLFLRSAVSQKELANILSGKGVDKEVFIQTLQERCRGLWIYLIYLIQEIEDGKLSVSNLDAIPNGLTRYYIEYWSRWRTEDTDRWFEAILPLISGLAAAREAVTLTELIDWLGLQKSHESHLRVLLQEHLRAFVTIVKGKQTRYRLYHATLRDFIAGQISAFRRLRDFSEADNSFLEELQSATKLAHRKIALHYLNIWGGINNGLTALEYPNINQDANNYGLRHLVFHLNIAELDEELHQLFALERQYENRSENLWFSVKESTGTTDSFLSDVWLAWRNASSNKQWSLQCRYALMTTTINSFGEKTSPELLKALVREGIWPPTQAILYARRVTSEAQRARAILSIVTHFPSSDRKALTQEAIDLAKGILQNVGAVDVNSTYELGMQLIFLGHTIHERLKTQMEGLHQLQVGALFSPESERDSSMSYAQGRLQAFEEEAAFADNCMQLGSELLFIFRDHDELASDFSLPTVLTDGLDGIEDNYHQIALLVQKLDSHTKPADVITAARGMSDFRARLLLLGGALNRLQNEARGLLLEEISSFLGEIQDFDEKAHALAYLSGTLGLKEYPPDEAFHAVMNVEDATVFEACAFALAPKLDETSALDLLSKARTLFRTVQYVNLHFTVAALATMPDAERENLFYAGLEIANRMRNERRAAHAISGLAAFDEVPIPVVDKAFSTLNAFTDSEDKFIALAQLTQLLPQTSRIKALKELLAKARTISDREALISAKIKLLSAIPPEKRISLLDNTYEASMQIDVSYWTLGFLRNLAVILAETGDSERAWQVVHRTSNKYEIAFICVYLTKFLPAHKHEVFLAEAESLAFNLVKHEQDAILAELCRVYHSTGKIEKGLELLENINNSITQANLLAEFFENTEEPKVRERILAATELFTDPYSKAVALLNIAKHVDEERKALLLEHALEAARQVEGTYMHQRLGLDWSMSIRDASELRVRALIQIGLQFTDNKKQEIMEEALEAAFRLESSNGLREPFEPVALILPHLPPLKRAKIAEKAITMAKNVEMVVHPLASLMALARLAKHLSTDEKQALHAYLMVKLVDSYTEREWHKVIAELFSHLELDGGNKIEEVIGKFIKPIAAKDREKAKFVILQLAKRLAAMGRIDESLAAGLQLNDEDRGYLIREIASWVEDSYEVLDVLPFAFQIHHQQSRTQALEAMTPHCVSLVKGEYGDIFGREIWDKWMSAIMFGSRSECLSDLGLLSPFIVEFASESAILDIIKAIDDVERWWP